MILARILRRGLDVLVLIFAAYGFVSVPLGEHTALEHLRAILGTPEAENAGREFKKAGVRFVDRIANERDVPPRPVRGTPVLPNLGQLGGELFGTPQETGKTGGAAAPANPSRGDDAARDDAAPRVDDAPQDN